jgi:hypothetical protein
MNILQSSKEQAASSATSLKTASNNISQEITVTKDTQTTVLVTPMHLELEDNQNGEMQVMAVAPINSVVEVDTRRIVIA